MIKSFKSKMLEQCWKMGDCRKIRDDLRRRVLMKLDSMDAATCLDDLTSPPSNRLHALKGELKEYWSIAVNGPWRLVFRFEDGDIFDVQLQQYH